MVEFYHFRIFVYRAPATILKSFLKFFFKKHIDLWSMVKTLAVIYLYILLNGFRYAYTKKLKKEHELQ
jgi:hypothetical protein